MKRSSDETTPFDPIALCLAVWLGCIVLVIGFMRLSERASVRAAQAQQASHSMEQRSGETMRAWMMANGG